MTPLAELLAALDAGTATGDDATLRAAWEAESDAMVLCRAVALLPDQLRRRANGALGGFFGLPKCVCGGGAFVCPACCAAIRAAVQPPTWAELTRAA